MKIARCSPILAILGCAALAAGQNGSMIAAPAPQSALLPSPSQAQSQGPPTLTFQDALTRARALVPEFNSARTDAAIAREDRVQARAAMLPGVTYNNQVLYTEPSRNPLGVVYISNNSVHEYVSQANAHEEIGLDSVYQYRSARAAEALAQARLQIASRGLVVTVAEAYYGLIVAQRKYGTEQAAMQEAQRFLTISQQLQKGGEVARSDVIKAQIQFNDRSRLLQEAQLALEKARLALAVLVFHDFNQDFSVVDDLSLSPPLPPMDEVHAAALRNNPDVAAALARASVAQAGVGEARAGYLPRVALDYWYGIDAPQFAVNGPDRTRNLGYAAAATLNIPIWNWGATQSKIRQANLRQEQAKIELSAAQRQLLANIQTAYHEAERARSELDLLRQSFELASDSLRLTTLRYQGGEATVLEVVDAQNTLTEARDAFDEAESRYRIALANLQTLTGSF
ncbi:MAG: TolC family protein [Acidobacteria bacterium]|nr:TolC family protein [Acidobacteriota bacterium]